MIPRLLLVDDHELVRVGIARILDDTCEVCGQASDGQEAVRKVLELKPDLVLLDVNMPVMGGAEAAREIRRVAPKTKIIFLSTHDPEAIGKLIQASGVDACVSKHSALEELYKTIARTLDIPYEDFPEHGNVIPIDDFKPS